MNQGAVAIVTGASGGFGREFVKLLLRQADVSEVWAIARDEGKLKRLAAGSEGKVRIFPMDLTDRTCFAEIERQLKQSHMPVKYLVNNAGFAKFCSYGDLSVGESLNMIDLNVGAVVALGLTCIPYMAKGGYAVCEVFPSALQADAPKADDEDLACAAGHQSGISLV